MAGPARRRQETIIREIPEDWELRRQGFWTGLGCGLLFWSLMDTGTAAILWHWLWGGN